MYEQIKKPKENTSSADRRKSRTVGNSVAQKKSSRKQGFKYAGNQRDVISLEKTQSQISNYSPHSIQKKGYLKKGNEYVESQQKSELNIIQNCKVNNNNIIQRSYWFYDPNKEGDDRYQWYRTPASLTLGIQERRTEGGNQEIYQDYGVWESTEIAQGAQHLAQGIRAYRAIGADIDERGFGNAVMANVPHALENVGDQAVAQLPEEQQAVLREAEGLVQELREWARRNSVKATGTLFGGVTLAVLLKKAIEELIKLLSIPWYMKLGITIAEAIYSIGVTIKLLKSISPYYVTYPLVALNLVFFAGGLNDIISNGLDGELFENFYALSLPGTLILEHLALYGLEKFANARQQRNEQDDLDP